MSQYIISILAERPENELRESHKKVRGEIARLRVELEQIDQALAKQAQRQARRVHRPSRRATASGGTREAVLSAIREAGADTISPAQIVATLHEQGSEVTSGGIRNMIRRLVDQGEVVRIREGAYTLPMVQNGSMQERDTEPHESEATEPSPVTSGHY